MFENVNNSKNESSSKARRDEKEERDSGRYRRIRDDKSRGYEREKRRKRDV